jgi:hypothetical protein
MFCAMAEAEAYAIADQARPSPGIEHAHGVDAAHDKTPFCSDLESGGRLMTLSPCAFQHNLSGCSPWIPSISLSVFYPVDPWLKINLAAPPPPARVCPSRREANTAAEKDMIEDYRLRARRTGDGDSVNAHPGPGRGLV